MQVIMAKEVGFCFGVKRAIKLAEKALREHGRVYSLGPIIHNTQVIEALREKGLEPLTDITLTDKKPVVIPSHGVSPEVSKRLTGMGMPLIDATCPNVKRVQRLALTASKRGYYVLVFGEKDHAEVKGILGYIEGKGSVFGSVEELKGIPFGKKVALLSQTTQDPARFQEVIPLLLERTEELLVHNTFCKVVISRQKEALGLASQVDCMIVVGSHHSANSRKLAEICLRVQPKTFQIETPKELKGEWFKDVNKVGLTGGTSTPLEVLKEVHKVLLSGHYVI